MLLLALAGAWSLRTLCQAEPAAPIPERDVELLRSNDIREREAAERRLGQLPASLVPFLRGRLSAERDCEARERLAAALRQICGVEAERLLEEGRVEDCIRWLTGLPDGDEREEVVLQTKQDVRRRIRGQLPESPCTDDFPQDYAILAAWIDHEFGPWGISVLFRAMENGESDVPAVAILQEMGDELVPCLARALRESGATLKREVSAVLYAMSFEHDRAVQDGHGLAEALAAVAEDPATDPGTQMRCRYVRERLRPADRDDEPVGEVR